MNREIKKRWVEDLRSDKYQQVQGALTRPGLGFCCLGVLCEQLVERGLLENGGKLFYELPDTHEYLESELGDRLLKSLGLTNYTQKKLIQMNDEQKLTFRNIADAIEKDIPEDDLPVVIPPPENEAEEYID